MDFAVCPSCGQSVLDDDAEDCPFCGASMKAKPGAKGTAAAKPPTPAKPAPPTAKPGTKPGAKPDPKHAGDDFPFDADIHQPNDAIPAAATASKGRSLQVVCPMCETTGYVPTSAAGKMVKCANPKCMVPLFRAPAPQAPKAAAPPPPPPKNNLVTIGLITAGVVAALGGGAYLFVVMSAPKTPVAQPLTAEQLRELAVKPPPSANGTPTTTVNPEETTADGTPKTADGGPATTADQTAFKASILKSMSELALLSGGQNRSKPLCRRLAAEAAAIDGQLKLAREHLGQLGAVGRDVPFYRVVPWVEVAWAEQAAKNADAAKAALDQALSESASLPKFGRDRLITATYLAAALAGAGRIPDAQKVLQDRESNDIDGELASALCWLIFDRKSTDLEFSFRKGPLLPRTAMQTSATAAVLVLRGQAAAALQFAKAAPAGETQRDAYAGWAEAAVRLNPTMPVAEIERELAALTPVQRAYILAWAARTAAYQKNKEAAQALLAPAVEVLAAQQPPVEFTIPALKALMKWKPAPTAELLALATSLGEIAIAQHDTGDNTAAEATLNRMLAVTRAIGPALALPLEKQKEIDGLGLAAMRDKLKKDLDLRSDDDARQALVVYRQAVTQLTAAAQERFEFQTAALSRAAALGMEKPIWNIVSQRTSTEDSTQAEPYFQTGLPGWLLFRFETTQATDDASALAAAFEQKVGGKIATPATAVLVDQMAAGKGAEAVAALAANRAFKGEAREAVVMRGVALLIQQNDLPTAWALIAKQDIVLREQAYQLAALLMARKGQAAEAWKRSEAVSGATEKESLGRGIIAGLNDAK